MYDKVLVLTLLVTGSLCYDGEYQSGFSSELQSDARYHQMTNLRYLEDNRPGRRNFQYGRELQLSSERDGSYIGQDAKTVIPLHTRPTVMSLLRPRTENSHLKTNPPVQDGRFPLRQNNRPSVIKSHSDRNDYTHDMGGTQGDDNANLSSNIEESQHSHRSGHESVYINTTPEPGYDSIESTTLRVDRTDNVQESEFNDFAKQPEENKEPSYERVNGREQKIPRRNFTFSNVNRNQPLQEPANQDGTRSLYNDQRTQTTEKTTRNNAKNFQDKPYGQAINQSSRNQGQNIRNSQFQSNNSYSRDNNSFDSSSLNSRGQTSPEDSRPAQNQKPTENKDEKWIWDGTKAQTQVTTPAANKTVIVDDRSNFMGDKCASGMIRVAGQCVDVD